ncbi:MAG: GntR family transcriptional regulator [Lachnospiraceae bacterium]|nr:GntR family transcriptional regulator [Lachnospiraceae bacterium]
MTALTPVKDTGSLRARVFAALENGILSGEYKAGDTMNELRLSRDLGVSRTPIREALMQLELEGLVETIQNKGAVVVGVSAQDVEDIYAIRLHIEGFASELATSRITEEELVALEKIIELQEFYIQKNDTDQIWKLDTDFHKLIYEASGNRSLRAMLTNFHNQIQRGRGLSLRAPGRAVKSVNEHRKILEAIKNRDAQKASELTTEHLHNALLNFRAEMQASLSSDL